MNLTEIIITAGVILVASYLGLYRKIKSENEVKRSRIEQQRINAAWEEGRRAGIEKERQELYVDPETGHFRRLD